ncbi:hypothetical protein RJ640_028206 [Escallonia rubra]|uniref:RING-type domain-containing protein n=1 Tax=Escallonia rubra TaxID=112253 RepID=A0AA88QLA6_9ASTE|nr:hypothetical protein RJ640_028206 [Escallonia rubra]
MSILPSGNLGPTSSSSSQIQSPNPNSNHGPAYPPDHQPQSVDRLSRQTRALQIPNSRGSIAVSDVPSELAASASQDAGGSSQKVNGARKPNGKINSSQGGHGSHPQREASSRAWVRADQHRGKLPETDFPARGQQISGPTTTHSAGRKTQMVNGNHLLNFQYDPISRPHQRAPPPRRQQKRKPYNKDLFLQANYKFVLLDSGTYAPDSMDPDRMLQWEDIICVRYSTPLPVQCPICLEDLLCPQLTSCGHIFCFPCILRYFFLGEDDTKGDCWKKCPLCFMMISSKDLYTIYIENVKQHCVGDAIDFMLLTRQKDSFTLSLKNYEQMDSNEEVQDSFSKFTFTSDVELSVRNAMSELDGWLARAESGLVDDMEKLPYVCAAMEQLEQRKKCWHEHLVCSDLPTESAANTDDGNHERGTLSASVADKSMLLASLGSDKTDRDPCLDVTADVIESYGDQDEPLSSSFDDGMIMQRHAMDLRNRKDNNSYNFYQVVDGQHLILHPLNMKCLLHHYGCYDKLPQRISGKILQLETVTQSEAMRRRYRYLSHFSLTTTFQLCEIDLSESLPRDALCPFMDEIKNREKQRKRLVRKEQEERIKAEAACADYVPTPSNFAESSYNYSPTFSMDDFEALGSPAVSSSSPPTIAERPLFSNVARLGFASGHDAPALKPEDVHIQPQTNVSTDASRVTGSGTTGTPSFANIISRTKPVESKANDLVKKGKKPNRVLLSTAGGRRY